MDTHSKAGGGPRTPSYFPGEEERGLGGKMDEVCIQVCILKKERLQDPRRRGKVGGTGRGEGQTDQAGSHSSYAALLTKCMLVW
jgi:hypothetical protein